MYKNTLFTIPFAGGNKYSFNEYDRFLKDTFNIYHLELPGHGKRFSEDLLRDIYTIRDDLFKQIEDKIYGDYVIYGHSLGGLLSYLLNLLIEDKKLNKPLKLIISGCASPTMKPTTVIHTLSKDDFEKHLRDLGGMPSDFFNHPELFELFEPILRADYTVAECFDYKEDRKVDTKLSILYGEDEEFSLKEALKWKEFTYHSPLEFKQFKGNHFFIYNHTESICKIIKEV